MTGEILSPVNPSPELSKVIRAQVTRILSLDVVGSCSAALGEWDPAVAVLQRRYPGLRPVGFWSPYQVAAWAIIGQPVRIRQAAAVKARTAWQLGEPVSFGDHVVHVFLAPQRLATLDSFPGLSGRKPGGSGRWPRPSSTASCTPPTCGACPGGAGRPDRSAAHRPVRGRADPAARRR